MTTNEQIFLKKKLIMCSKDKNFLNLFFDNFFMLSPESKHLFNSRKKKEKALYGLFRLLNEKEPDEFYYEYLKKKHKKMNISEDEFKFFRSSFILSINVTHKLSLSELQLLRDKINNIILKIDIDHNKCLVN